MRIAFGRASSVRIRLLRPARPGDTQNPIRGFPPES